MSRLRIGISACLLGREVRYDGGHKRDRAVLALGRGVEWVVVCPELELGLGVPREPIRLEGRPGAPRLRAVKSGVDLTEAMRGFAVARVRELEALRLAGFVLKSRSPSCGVAGVPVHLPRGGSPAPVGVGLFARALMARFPGMPVVEESGLADPRARREFLARARAFRDTL